MSSLFPELELRGKGVSQYRGLRTVGWRTPISLFQALDDEFEFTLDAAADVDSCLCNEYFDSDHDGLNESWDGENVWCNPPFEDAALWIAKGRLEASLGATVVMLLPVRTGNKAWHEHIFGVCDEIRFVEGRIKFKGAKFNAPFDVAIVVWRGREE